MFADMGGVGEGGYSADMDEFGDAGYSDGQNTYFSDGQNASSSLDFSARGSSPSSLAECETFDTFEINKLTPGQFLLYWVKEVHHVTNLSTLKPRFGRFDGIVYSNPRTVLLVEFRNDKYWCRRVSRQFTDVLGPSVAPPQPSHFCGMFEALKRSITFLAEEGTVIPGEPVPVAAFFEEDYDLILANHTSSATSSAGPALPMLADWRASMAESAVGDPEMVVTMAESAVGDPETCFRQSEK